jgi:hypothetical protein
MSKELFLCGSMVAALMVLKNVSLSEKKDLEMQLNYCAKLTSDSNELSALLAQNGLDRCNFASGVDNSDYSSRLKRSVACLLDSVRVAEEANEGGFIGAAQELVACLQEIKRLCYMKGGYARLKPESVSLII